MLSCTKYSLNHTKKTTGWSVNLRKQRSSNLFQTSPAPWTEINDVFDISIKTRSLDSVTCVFDHTLRNLTIQDFFHPYRTSIGRNCKRFVLFLCKFGISIWHCMSGQMQNEMVTLLSQVWKEVCKIDLSGLDPN